MSRLIPIACPASLGTAGYPDAAAGHAPAPRAYHLVHHRNATPIDSGIRYGMTS